VAKPENLTAAAVQTEATGVSAVDLALVALAERAAGIVRDFEPLYLRSPDVTLSAGPKRVVQ
jgi:hypothetical protein